MSHFNNKVGDASGEENAAYSDQAPSDTVTPVDVFESDVATKQPLEVEVAISDQDVVHDKPYSGMGKEDLVRFSDTPFWNRFRLISVLLFWAAWLALLGAVIGLTIVAPRCSARATPTWWQKSIVYQIYVRSFFDSDGDGIGDIQGIRDKLDYLEDLKVDAILLSSIYQANVTERPDYGYDLTDHKAVHSDYGTMKDIELLIEDAHNRSISVLLDFIPNYTGTEHLWFQQSSGNDVYTNPYWNYYIWATCDGLTPLNNWQSVYGGSAWMRPGLGLRDQCYLHQFLPTQPELNLRSSAVQEELSDILKFWLDKGIDGFKVTATAYLFESQDLKNESTACFTSEAECLYTRSQPETLDIIKRWRTLLDEYSMNDTERRPRVLLTDSDINLKDSLMYYGARTDGSHLPVNYQLSKLNYTTCDGRCVRDLIKSWIEGMPADGTADWLNGDQDRSRTRTQAGDRFVNALNLLKMTLPGSAIIYYGEEIGMRDYTEDPQLDPIRNRDAYRTPMQWTNETLGGFTQNVTSWLPVDPTAEYNNVLNQSLSDDSTLGIFKALGRMRAELDSLQYGKMHYVSVDSARNILAYVREQEGFDRLLVVINFGSGHAHNVDLTRGASSISIPNKADIVLVVNSPDYTIDNTIDLRKVMLDAGQGFIAKWEYTRPM